MSVVRVNKTKDYVTMSNNHFKQKNLSLKAKGLLSEMLSLPDDWDYSIKGLVAINKENESAIKTTLDELKEFGYVKVTKVMPNETKSGRIEYIYDIFENPKQDGEKQGVENLGVEFLGVENQGQYNINNISINNKSINNNIYSREDKIPYKEIIDYLNEKVDANYKYTTENTKRLIRARYRENFKIDDFKKVIDIKTKEWLNSNYSKYLRPETLFGNKFESYLNEKEKEDTDFWEGL